MDSSNTKPKKNSVMLKAKVFVYNCRWKLRKLLRVNRKDGQRPGVTISSQTEIGQAEGSVKIPLQRAYTGSKLVIPSSLADTPCYKLGIRGLLDSLNTTLGTSYTFKDTPSLSPLLKDCIAENYDFGTAYGRLRRTWHSTRRSTIQDELREHEAKDTEQRRTAVDGSRIVNPLMQPRRVWDLYSNRVVPWWCCRTVFFLNKDAKPISHAWVAEDDRADLWTPINGREWPVPFPKGASLDLIRIEMLNLGMEYIWLDVLCLRQRGGPREDLRAEEWKLDVPTIGGVYWSTNVVTYLSGLGLPFSLEEGDLESDRSWFRRAWTVQEIGRDRTIAGDTPDGPLHAKPTDDAGNYEDKVLTRFHKLLASARDYTWDIYGILSAMQDRISTNPVDKVAGLSFSLRTRSIPAYYENESQEDAWTALVNVMEPRLWGSLFFTYPEPGAGSKKWRPSWKQVMETSLPKNVDVWFLLPNAVDGEGYARYEGFCIERGFVRGLAVSGGEDGMDRHGKLVVEDADGTKHAFNIVASHSVQIPEDTYTLLGSKDGFTDAMHRCWVLGRRLPGNRFEKVSVFTIPDPYELDWLAKLGIYVESSTGILL